MKFERKKTKDPFAQTKRSWVVVSSKMPYQHEVLEQNLVKYLVEKVIIMREMPFMLI